MKHIAIATSTRADWGLLSAPARALASLEGVRVSIVATNMHLNPAYGMTVKEIEADGFEVAERVPMLPASDSDTDTAAAAGECLAGMARALGRLRPDRLIILGDRYEMLTVATAATILRIPIVHIAGGEVSEGAIDNRIRDAITQLSWLHLTATEPYRQRVISLGQPAERVVNTGAIGVWNFSNITPMPKEELEKQLDMKLDRATLLVTLHPATLDPRPVEEHCQALLDALDRFPESNILFTYPNNDPDGAIIIEMINSYALKNPERVRVVPSLGKLRYLSALRYVGAVVGNSSSGIVEVPSTGIPTVDIGIRQKGRIAGESVIHCDSDARSIADAIAFALSPRGQQMAARASNPYYKPDTLQLMVDAIKNDLQI